MTMGKVLMQQEPVFCEPITPAHAVSLCFKDLLEPNLVHNTSS